MAKKTCSRCGTSYSGFFSRCPQCSYEEGTPLSEEEKNRYTKTTLPEPSIAKENTRVSNWYTFAKVLIIVESIALSILFLLTLLSDELTWMTFAIISGAYLFELTILAMLQLLAKIEQNTCLYI